MVNYLLDLGMDIEEPGLSGRDPVTPLWFAVCFGRNVTLVKLLLQRGAKPQLAPGHGLYAAGWWEDTHILEVLIKAGAEVDLVGEMTPFFACWNWRRFESAKFLARKGANVNFQDPRNGKTALHYGVEKEFDPAMLKWLMKHGASADIKDNEGVTPLLKASRKRDKRYFQALNST